MSRSLPVALALALLSLAVAVPAQAIVYSITFTVLADPADAAHVGQTATGSFSFDGSIIPLGGGTVVSPALTNVNFSWDGTTWTDANAGSFYLGFDAGGNLTNWFLGGDPTTVSGIDGSPGAPDDFWVKVAFSDFTYHDDSTPSTTILYGTLTSWSVSTGNAPEPGTFALLGPGLLALGLVRRRKS